MFGDSNSAGSVLFVMSGCYKQLVIAFFPVLFLFFFQSQLSMNMPSDLRVFIYDHYLAKSMVWVVLSLLHNNTNLGGICLF